MGALANKTTLGHAQKIWNYLLQGNTITSRQAQDLFGCDRLASRIWDIRQKYDMVDCKCISKNMIEVKNRYGATVRVAQYSINPVFAQRLLSAKAA